jgi:hypothetical protein
MTIPSSELLWPQILNSDLNLPSFHPTSNCFYKRSRISLFSITTTTTVIQAAIVSNLDTALAYPWRGLCSHHTHNGLSPTNRQSSISLKEKVNIFLKKLKASVIYTPAASPNFFFSHSFPYSHHFIQTAFLACLQQTHLCIGFSSHLQCSS